MLGRGLPGYKGGQKEGVDPTWAIRKSVTEEHRVLALVLSFESLIQRIPEGISGREMSRNTEQKSWAPGNRCLHKGSEGDEKSL